MATVYLALGSNLGQREGHIQQAVKELTAIGLHIEKLSSIIETEPVDGPPQGKFLNAVLKAKTEFTAPLLLQQIKTIEKNLGRTPTVRNGPRVIDIDILLYDNLKLKSAQLTIPHPRMKERDFVMQPLLEIAPELIKDLK